MNKNQWTFKDDNEWYTCLIDVENFVNHNSNIDFSKLIVWFPFDKKESAFVRFWKSKNWKYVESHIDAGEDFYNFEPVDYDLIISNPPFKGKRKIIERLIELKKPFALIFGIQCFNSGGFSAELSKLKNLSLIFLQKRIKFHKGDETIKLSSPTFHSMWIMDGKIWEKKISFILIKEEKKWNQKTKQKMK